MLFSSITGTGTFTTSAITGYDAATTITVTRISLGTIPGTCATVISANNTATLPIELLFFRGEKLNGTALLTWSTASERDNDYMAVERSRDGRNWQELGRVPGAGTTSTPQDYRFTDAKPLSGVNYYRLRQVDFDGKMEYHRIIALDFGKDKGEALLLPNPTRSRLTVLLPDATDDGRELLLFNTQGMLLRRYAVAANNAQLEIGVEELPGGVYFLRLADQEGVWRFVKE